MANITISMDTVTGNIGLARIAPAVAIAADTPQIEIPEESTADASRLNRKTRRASQ